MPRLARGRALRVVARAPGTIGRVARRGSSAAPGDLPRTSGRAPFVLASRGVTAGVSQGSGSSFVGPRAGPDCNLGRCVEGVRSPSFLEADGAVTEVWSLLGFRFWGRGIFNRKRRHCRRRRSFVPGESHRITATGAGR